MNCTRLEIAYAVSKLSRFISNPSDDHWIALLWVIGYISNIKEYALLYEKYPPVLERYNDTNWITDSEESKSTSGYIFTLRGMVVSWKFSKQTCIAHSTMKSEFIALDKSGEEAEWLWQVIEDIPLWPKPVLTICIHCDNQAAISMAQNFLHNGKSKHIHYRHNIGSCSQMVLSLLTLCHLRIT